MTPAERYLADLGSRLHVRPRERARILEEVRDHLDDAVTQREQAGDDQAVALDRALVDFGSPQQLANEFNVDAGTRAMRRGPAIALLSGVAVLTGFLLAATTQPTSSATAAPITAQVSFFVAVVAFEVAFVAGCCAASRVAAHWRSLGVPAADRSFVRRGAITAITMLALAAGAWTTAIGLALDRSSRPDALTSVGGTAVMIVGVLLGAVMVARLRVNPTDDVAHADEPSTGLLGVGERSSRLIARRPVLSCVVAAAGSAALAMRHAESTLSGALPWGAAQALAVVVAYVLLGPRLGLRSPRLA